MRNILSLVFLFLCFGKAFSQTKASALRNTLLIGEQTELIYEVELNKNPNEISFNPKTKSITCFRTMDQLRAGEKGSIQLEIIGEFQDTILRKQNSYIWQGSYTITSWDSGKVIIPPTSIQIFDSTYQFDEIALFISTPKIKEGKGLYDIKEEFAEVPSKLSSFLKDYWIYITVILLTLALLLWWIWRRKKKKKEEILPEIKLSLNDQTIAEIDKLVSEKLWEQDKLKEHYYRLSLILRHYLQERYKLSLLDKTTYQIQLLLAKKELHTQLLKDIEKILNQSDLVKFAKSAPGINEINACITITKEIVTKTSNYGV